MISNKPYLLRAFYQWIIDSACTPILVVDATQPKCKIPVDYIEDGEIVFNVSPTAIRDLKITNELVEFKASFSGIIHIISAPVSAILAIYAEENNEGLFFDAEDENSDGDGTSQLKSIEGSTFSGFEQSLNSSDNAVKSKPFLKLVE